MLTLKPTTQYKKDRKRAIKRGLPMNELDKVIGLLQEEEPLEAKYRDHALAEDYQGFRECHIQPDWLFIYAVDGYAVDGENLILIASRTGTDADVFE